VPVAPEELGRRLRVAREACRMTQENVAAELGCSRAAVTQMELGNRSVSSIELDQLAYLYGRDIREFLADEFRERDALAAIFRAEAAPEEPDGILERLRECMALGRELTSLERLLGIDRDASLAATYPMPVPRSRWEAVQQGQRIADEERRRLGFGWAPAPNLTEVLESQGVRTGLINLPDDISGLTIADPEVGIFIVANLSHHFWRRRFSFAHEYSHVLLDRDALGMVSRASQRDALVEVRANAFAASFLMPEDGVRQFMAGLGKGRPRRAVVQVFDGDDALSAEGRAPPGTQAIQLYDVVQLAHHFGVSRIAALFRLRNLKLISSDEFEILRAHDSAGQGKEIAEVLDLKKPEHDEARSWFRQRVIGVALEAYRREEITRSKFDEVARLVHVPTEQLEHLLIAMDLDDFEEGDVLLPED